MRKIMIIGAGGIGSYLASFLDRIGIYDVTIFDDDKVEEKNLTYQNFTAGHLGMHKVDVFVNAKSNPYQVLVEKQLQGYDLVICCADNLTARRLVYSQGFGDDAKLKWLDLRSQGRNAALISYKIDPNLMDTLLAGPDGSFSCQGSEWDGKPEGINCMHMVIAGAATQWIQRWWNDNNNVIDKMVMNI
tara:strand:+ start:3004 stop:3567 length:564 start_codon:yes stop_codon:yes gene_type:complete